MGDLLDDKFNPIELAPCTYPVYEQSLTRKLPRRDNEEGIKWSNLLHFLHHHLLLMIATATTLYDIPLVVRSPLEPYISSDAERLEGFC